MKKNTILVSAVLLVCFIFLFCNQCNQGKESQVNSPTISEPEFPKLTGPYLGQKPPGSKAELFAYDLLSAGKHEHHRIFSPDGKEFIYSIITANGILLVEPKGVFGKVFIMYSRMEKGYWTEPKEFLYGCAYRIGYPSFSPDGNRLYFNSWGNRTTRPEKPSSCIWYIDRQENGWSEPKEVDFGEAYQGRGTVHPTVAANGNIYFAQFPDRENGFLYVSRYENGKYSLPEKLSDTINEEYGNHPYIAPDESFILFDSDRAEVGFGTTDIYISFRDKDGNWKKPQNLGPGVNSQYDERRPFLTYDRKYLFFASDRINPEKPDGAITITQLQKLTNVPTNSYQHMYWADARVIEDLRPKDLK